MATFESLKIQHDTPLPVTLDTWGSCERVYGLIGPQWDGFERVYLDVIEVKDAIKFTSEEPDGLLYFDGDVLMAGDMAEVHPVPTVSVNGETYWDFGGWEFERWHGHDYQPRYSRLSGTLSHVCQNCGAVRIGAEERDFQDPWEDATTAVNNLERGKNG